LRKEHPQQEVFKDIKWVLFKSKIDLQQQQKLDDAFKKAPLLEELVTLRNQFNNLFDIAPNALWLNQQLDIWHKESSQLALPAIGKFLKTLKNWQILIANFAENKLTNAATEGLNNLIRYVKRISFGIPNFEHMRLRVLLNFT
jgi:transposase